MWVQVSTKEQAHKHMLLKHYSPPGAVPKLKLCWNLKNRSNDVEFNTHTYNNIYDAAAFNNPWAFIKLVSDEDDLIISI